jgi:L-lysine exporter family protein LysE/ArgO
MFSTVVTGLLTGLSLIVAIGAQNAFVLRQGLRRDHVTAVVAVCVTSDIILIVAGTLGVGALVQAVPAALTVLTWLGATYLVWFAIGSLRSAVRPGALSDQPAVSTGRVVARTLALTWLNPHVYLDTVVLLGSLANHHGVDGRWAFAAGASAGSALWFAALGFGARVLARPLGRPAVWRVVDGAIGVTMLALSGLLLTRA